MINVVDYTEDIKAIRETVNLLNMVTEAQISKVVAVDYLNAAGGIGLYKVNLPIYKLGLVSILVNRNNHEVLGFYGKLIETQDKSKLIGIKLDLASEQIVIEIIGDDGTVLKSIKTDKDINCYCSISNEYVKIADDKYMLN